MRGVYTAKIDISSLSSAKTLLLIQAPAGKVVEILSAKVTQTNSTTLATLQCQLRQVTTYGSPTGTSVTPAQQEPGDQGSGSTVLGNLTAEPTTYNANGHVDDQGWNTLAGYFYQPTPEERPVISAGGALGLYLPIAPSSLNLSVEITYREIG